MMAVVDFPNSQPSTQKLATSVNRLEIPPMGSRLRCGSMPETPSKKVNTSIVRKEAPAHLNLTDDNTRPRVASTSVVRSTTTRNWKHGVESSRSVSSSTHSAEPSSVATGRKPRPLPLPKSKTPSQPTSAAGSVRPLPSPPSSSLTTASTRSASAPLPTSTISAALPSGVRPLPRPPTTNPIPEKGSEIPRAPVPDGPPLPPYTPSIVEPASNTSTIGESPKPLQVVEVPKTPASPQSISFDDPKPSRPSISIIRPHTLFSGQSLVRVDMSPRTVRRLKGAAVSTSEAERNMLANVLRQLDIGIPEEFFCEAILSRGATQSDSPIPLTPMSILSSRSKRTTILSYVSDDTAYEVSFRRMGDGDDEFDEDEEEAEIITWDWAVKSINGSDRVLMQSIVLPSPRQKILERHLSKRSTTRSPSISMNPSAFRSPL